VRARVRTARKGAGRKIFFVGNFLVENTARSPYRDNIRETRSLSRWSAGVAKDGKTMEYFLFIHTRSWARGDGDMSGKKVLRAAATANRLIARQWRLPTVFV